MHLRVVNSWYLNFFYNLNFWHLHLVEDCVQIVAQDLHDKFKVTFQILWQFEVLEKCDIGHKDGIHLNLNLQIELVFIHSLLVGLLFGLTFPHLNLQLVEHFDYLLKDWPVLLKL